MPSCAAVRDLATGGIKKSDLRDVFRGIVECNCSRTDKLFLGRDPIESIEHPVDQSTVKY
jgi:hypothetical protein